MLISTPDSGLGGAMGMMMGTMEFELASCVAHHVVHTTWDKYGSNIKNANWQVKYSMKEMSACYDVPVKKIRCRHWYQKECHPHRCCSQHCHPRKECSMGLLPRGQGCHKVAHTCGH
jgi:hypothetical protein